ncbi:MAG: helix-turn-helix domain-containing protein [Planctomycetaceae bacterium]|nr:helix-turn-helix domain-containing protein [Planctomycetaceae bacterium]
MPVKSFSPEARAEALQLLKDGHPQKEVAEQVGCSIASLQSWKQQAKGKKNGKKKKAKSGKKVAAAVGADTGCTCECCACVSFDDFVRDYWAKCPKAGEVLTLPPDMMPEAVKYVNNVLKYAYNHLCGK